MKKLFAILLLCFSAQAYALEIEGVKLADTVQVEKATLKLNGGGLRSVFSFIKIYVAALYLENKTTSADAVLADKGYKRIELHVLGESGSERFVHGFRKGIEKNHDKEQLAKLMDRMAAFEKFFDGVKSVTKGDVMAFEWLPGVATRVTFNGKELGRIEGEDFYRALLAIWIGEHPVLDDLKQGMLGG